MCSRCHKRVAVVFITRIENNETKNEGICLKCARELGIKPVNDMLEKMGMTEEDLDSITSDVNGMFGAVIPSEFDEEGGAPAIDLPKIFNESGLAPFSEGVSNKDNKKDKQKKKTRVFLLLFLFIFPKFLRRFVQNLF